MAKKEKWSAEVTEHSDALDLKAPVFEKGTEGDSRIAETLGREKHEAQGGAFPLGHVHADLLYQSRWQEFPSDRKKVLDEAKDELRRACGRSADD